MTDAAAQTAPRTLLLTLVFTPDGVSTATILAQLTDQLSARGHRIAVVTTTPHYNEDRQELAAQPLRNRCSSLLQESRRGAVPVYHVRMRRKGVRVLGRLIDYVLFHAFSTVAAFGLAGQFDVVFAPSPPLTIGLQAMLLASVRRVPFVYNVQEIYPDLAVTLGMLKNRLLIRILEALERFIYRKARIVVVISDRFRQRLLDKGVPDSKLAVIPNFVDTDFIQPRPQLNAFSVAHGLDGKFVALYAGNIGLTQDFDIVLTAAEHLRHLHDFRFLIVGDGAIYRSLQQRIAERALDNVILLPYQPKGRVPDLYATSAVCIVPLLAGAGHETFPSKIYTIMAAGRPAVVVSDVGSELSDVVLRAESGLVVPPGDVGRFVETLRHLYDDRELVRNFAANGREYVLKFHSADAVGRQYDELLRKIAAPASSS